MKLDNLRKTCVEYAPGTQSQLEFWNVIWFENYTLASRCPQLYNICTNQNITIAEVINSQGNVIKFKRSLSGILTNELHEIIYLISASSFTHYMDKVAWRWESSG